MKYSRINTNQPTLKVNSIQNFLSSSDLLGMRGVLRSDYDEPTYVGFKIKFDFMTPKIGELGANYNYMPQGLLGDMESAYSAEKYLRSIDENERADAISGFRQIMWDLSENVPHYIQKVTGIDTLYKLNTEDNFRAKEAKINLELLEGIDYRSTALLDLYRRGAYDPSWMRWLLPDIHRYFGMTIYIVEFRNFHVPSNAARDSGGSHLDEDGKENVTKISTRSKFAGSEAGSEDQPLHFLKALEKSFNVHAFRLEECEIDLKELKSTFGDEINMAEGGDALKATLPIKIGKIREIAQYSLLETSLFQNLEYLSNAVFSDYSNYSGVQTQAKTGSEYMYLAGDNDPSVIKQAYADLVNKKHLRASDDVIGSIGENTFNGQEDESLRDRLGETARSIGEKLLRDTGSRLQAELEAKIEEVAGGFLLGNVYGISPLQLAQRLSADPRAVGGAVIDLINAANGPREANAIIQNIYDNLPDPSADLSQNSPGNSGLTGAEGSNLKPTNAGLTGANANPSNGGNIGLTGPSTNTNEPGNAGLTGANAVDLNPQNSGLTGTNPIPFSGGNVGLDGSTSTIDGSKENVELSGSNSSINDTTPSNISLRGNDDSINDGSNENISLTGNQNSINDSNDGNIGLTGPESPEATGDNIGLEGSSDNINGTLSNIGLSGPEDTINGSTSNVGLDGTEANIEGSPGNAGLMGSETSIDGANENVGLTGPESSNGNPGNIDLKGDSVKIENPGKIDLTGAESTIDSKQSNIGLSGPDTIFENPGNIDLQGNISSIDMDPENIDLQGTDIKDIAVGNIGLKGEDSKNVSPGNAGLKGAETSIDMNPENIDLEGNISKTSNTPGNINLNGPESKAQNPGSISLKGESLNKELTQKNIGFSGADLRQQVLGNAGLTGAESENARPSNAGLTGASNNEATLTNINLTGNESPQANVANVGLTGASTPGIDLGNVGLTGAESDAGPLANIGLSGPEGTNNDLGNIGLEGDDNNSYPSEGTGLQTSNDGQDPDDRNPNE